MVDTAFAPANPVRVVDVRYSRVAIAFHWALAFLILLQIVLGWWMNEWVPDHSPAQKTIEGVHNSTGLTILILVVARIAWRLAHRPPLLSPYTPMWERWLSRSVQWLFYILMLALPLTGWAMVSMHKSGSISFWGLPFPQMPGMATLGGANPRLLRGALQLFHTNILIWVVLANLALHVAGALKHQFDGRPVLQRMWPGRSRL